MDRVLGRGSFPAEPKAKLSSFFNLSFPSPPLLLIPAPTLIQRARRFRKRPIDTATVTYRKSRAIGRAVVVPASPIPSSGPYAVPGRHHGEEKAEDGIFDIKVG